MNQRPTLKDEGDWNLDCPTAQQSIVESRETYTVVIKLLYLDHRVVLLFEFEDWGRWRLLQLPHRLTHNMQHTHTHTLVTQAVLHCMLEFIGMRIRAEKSDVFLATSTTKASSNLDSPFSVRLSISRHAKTRWRSSMVCAANPGEPSYSFQISSVNGVLLDGLGILKKTWVGK